MTEIATGSVVSHYRILSPVGEGGMGVVYLAEDVTLSRRAALKFLPEKNHTEPAVLERFLREARAASALNHPGICTIYEFGEHAGRSFLAMEFLDGKSLDKIQTTQPMPLDRLLDFGIQASDALDAAHRKGIVHRDIKPANLFLSPSGQIKVLDFGLAKLTETAAPDVTSDATSDPDAATEGNSLTSAGSAVGTVAYMSPEQARGEKLDARTDLFSLGVVLYQLATGKHPFGGTTTAVIFDNILNHTPTAPLELNASASGGVWAHSKQGARQGPRPSLSIGGRSARRSEAAAEGDYFGQGGCDCVFRVDSGGCDWRVVVFGDKWGGSERSGSFLGGSDTGQDWAGEDLGDWRGRRSCCGGAGFCGLVFHSAEQSLFQREPAADY